MKTKDYIEGKEVEQSTGWNNLITTPCLLDFNKIEISMLNLKHIIIKI